MHKIRLIAFLPKNQKNANQFFTLLPHKNQLFLNDCP
jgi:hypothetical protein